MWVVVRVAVVVLSGAAAIVADSPALGLEEFDEAVGTGAGARTDVADVEAVGAGVVDVDATGAFAVGDAASVAVLLVPDPAGMVWLAVAATGETAAGFVRRK